MSQKLIGLTGPSSFSAELMECAEEYLKCNFVLLYQKDVENINYWLEKVDGVILAGGIDVHPSIYGKSIGTRYNLSKFDVVRDRREIQVIDYCYHQKKPMLGICRGHQLLGIYYGMNFLMDLSGEFISHSPSKAGISLTTREPAHDVVIKNFAEFKQAFAVEEDVSDFAIAYKSTKRAKHKIVEKKERPIWVNSFHHQAVIFEEKTNYEEGYAVKVWGTAKSGYDNPEHIIELMEATDRPWVSCQWHPEHDWKDNVYSSAILRKFYSMMG